MGRRVVALLSVAALCLLVMALLSGAGVADSFSAKAHTPVAAATETAIAAIPTPVCLGCTGPLPRVFGSLYVWEGGRWVQDRTVGIKIYLARPIYLGQLVQFRLADKLHVPRYRPSFAEVGIFRALRSKKGGLPGTSARPIMTLRMKRGPNRDGYAHFSVGHTFTSPGVTGQFFAEIRVTSRVRAVTGPDLLFSIRKAGK